MKTNIAKERAGQATCRRKNQKKRWHIQKKTAKKLQDVADGKAQLHDEFPELQDNQRSTITAILTNSAVIIGLHFEHMWFFNNQIVLYQGHVLSVKCSKRSNMPNVTATYWKHDENQDKGDDVTI